MTLACPSCREPMQGLTFARRVFGELAIDACWSCRAIWFDQYESAQLAPGAVIELFRLIHEHGEQGPRPLADRMDCPRCGTGLALTQDVQRSNRLTYHRCPNGHGRLTTFFQFLREKQFIRSLSGPEIERLKASIAQVRCSSCGAPVDLARDAVCSFCRAPISILDPRAVQEALNNLGEAERTGAHPQAAAVAAALAGFADAPRRTGAMPLAHGLGSAIPAAVLVDLVAEGIGRLFE